MEEDRVCGLKKEPLVNGISGNIPLFHEVRIKGRGNVIV